MGKLTRFELRKLIQQKSFYLCTIISLVFLSLNFVLAKKLSSLLGDNAITGTGSILTTIGSLSFTLILSISIVLFVTDDYAGGTIKNVFSKGYTRSQVFFAKYFASLLGTLLFTLICMLFSFVVGTALGEMGTIDHTLILTLLSQIVLLVAYHTMYFCFAIVIGRSGGAIASCIIAPTVFSLLYSLLDSWIRFKNFTFKSILLDNLLNTLSTNDISQTMLRQSVFYSILYIAAFGIVGLILSNKKEY